MALKGMDIFKLLPKSNCKKCGSPSCMAFAMKVAAEGITIDKCPDISAAALAALSEASPSPKEKFTKEMFLSFFEEMEKFDTTGITDEDCIRLGLKAELEYLAKTDWINTISSEDDFFTEKIQNEFKIYSKAFYKVKETIQTDKKKKELAAKEQEDPDWLGMAGKFLKKGVKVALGVAAAAAEAEANAPVVGWQCLYCGQVIYAKKKPLGWCPRYYMAGSNASSKTLHNWQKIN